MFSKLSHSIPKYFNVILIRPRQNECQRNKVNVVAGVVVETTNGECPGL